MVRGSLVMRGYHRDRRPARSQTSVESHGRHRLPRRGHFLFVVDRARDMVITGGFNVYSTEVEQAIMQHPAVQDCAVVGLPDDTWGERVTAVVQLRAGATAGPAEIGSFVRGRLGGVKTPKQIEIWPTAEVQVGNVLKDKSGQPHVLTLRYRPARGATSSQTSDRRLSRLRLAASPPSRTTRSDDLSCAARPHNRPPRPDVRRLRRFVLPALSVREELTCRGADAGR